MSKTAELKSAGTSFVMNSVVWDTYAKMAQVVCTALASMEKGYSPSAKDAAARACDSLLMQRAVALLAELFCDTLNKVNAEMFEQYHPGYRVSQLVVGKYDLVKGNLPFEAVLKGRGNSRCYKIIGHAHPALTFDHDGIPSLDWHLSSRAEGETPPSRIGTRVARDDYQGFVTV